MSESMRSSYLLDKYFLTYLYVCVYECIIAHRFRTPELCKKNKGWN